MRVVSGSTLLEGIVSRKVIVCFSNFWVVLFGKREKVSRMGGKML